MKIKSVAVLGAGAVGSYVIWGLSQKPEVRLGVIAEGERADRLRKNGCANNGRIYHPEVWSPEEAHNVDLLVVALKYGSLEGTLKSIQKTTGGHTVVMSLMNGVDSEEIIGRTVGTEHVLPALIKVASHKEDDGYHFDPPTTLEIIFGEPSAPFDSERVRAVEALFTDTGIHFRSTEYIQEEIWCKFRLNVYNNLPQAILGTSVGCYRDSVHMKAISDGLKRELEMVAKAKGIDMSKTGSSSGRGSVVPPTARYSTLQDLDAGRHTEIDMFSGALVRMGKELGIPMPYNEYTYHMIKALEEKNDGKFNYTGNQKPIIEITVNENAVIHFEL
ncbi:MAG: ketopantoate reductase family protein [Coprococcus sp.]